MRNSSLPESNVKITILENEESDNQPDGPRLQGSRQFLRKIMSAILAMTTGTLLLAFLIRYLRLHVHADGATPS